VLMAQVPDRLMGAATFWPFAFPDCAAFDCAPVGESAANESASAAGSISSEVVDLRIVKSTVQHIQASATESWPTWMAASA
jgi:hypothetical protein